MKLKAVSRGWEVRARAGGCESDDKVILGGKDAFLSHFCTYFHFNICFSNEKKAAKELNRFFNDSDRINTSLEGFISGMDRKV